MSKAHDRFRRFCAWVIGIVFLFSGTVKLMDPMGASLVVQEYFKFMHLGFLRVLSMPIAVGMSILETVTGVALITGVWRRLFAVVTACMMTFFTLLTIVLAVVNPEIDCGCFGQALKLTHAQSLLKNIVLCALAAAAFLPFKDFGKPRKVKYVSFFIVSISTLAFLIYCIQTRPIKDFTAYRPGAQIMAARTLADQTVVQDVFIYEKDSLQQEFTLKEELPDTSWTFIRTLTGTNDKLPDAPVLSFYDKWNEEYADSLAASGDVLVISVYDPDKFTDKMKAGAMALMSDAENIGYTCLFLTTSDQTPQMDNEYQSDFRTLIGLNRSNGGLTIIQDGFIARKWSRRNYPSFDELDGYYGGEAAEAVIDSQTRGDLLFESFLLYLAAVLILL